MNEDLKNGAILRLRRAFLGSKSCFQDFFLIGRGRISRDVHKMINWRSRAECPQRLG